MQGGHVLDGTWTYACWKCGCFPASTLLRCLYKKDMSSSIPMDHGHFPDFSYGLVKWLNQFALDNPKYNYINISD